MGDGWMIRLRASERGEFDDLLDDAAYEAIAREE